MLFMYFLCSKWLLHVCWLKRKLISFQKKKAAAKFDTFHNKFDFHTHICDPLRWPCDPLLGHNLDIKTGGSLLFLYKDTHQMLVQYLIMLTPYCGHVLPGIHTATNTALCLLLPCLRW